MKIRVVESVLKANDALAEANRKILNENRLLAVNLMSAPGSGKTTLLKRTITALAPDLRSAVLVGDLQTTRDAERLGDLAAQVVQINTGEGCHLDASQVNQGLANLNLGEVDILFIENVGNLVCPASFNLGEHLRIILLSLPEGDDKVAKYPVLFQRADAVLLTKIDLASVMEFNRDTVLDDLKKINSAVPLLELSAKSGEGFDRWLKWLRSQVN